MRRAAFLAALLAAPAAAKVVTATDTAMVVESEAIVAAAPETVWAALVVPSRWWSSQHSWSGSAANMELGERVGGCFCETLPNGGAVEHARVIRIEPNRMLRLSGGLGPFQAEAVSGPLTWTLEPAGKGTRLRVRYALAGAMMPPLSAMAPIVDTMLTEQLRRLKAAAEK